jgi:hypothetical protein
MAGWRECIGDVVGGVWSKGMKATAEWSRAEPSPACGTRRCYRFRGHPCRGARCGPPFGRGPYALPMWAVNPNPIEHAFCGRGPHAVGGTDDVVGAVEYAPVLGAHAVDTCRRYGAESSVHPFGRGPHAFATGGESLAKPWPPLGRGVPDACPAHRLTFIQGCRGVDEVSSHPCGTVAHPSRRHRPRVGQGFGLAGGAGALGFFFG